MTDDLSYDDWKKEIEIWSEFTELPPEKIGPAVYFSLKGKCRQTALAEVDFDKLKKEGTKIIFDCLDRLYAKNKAESSFAAFDDFIKFKRPESMSIKDYIIEFNLKLKKVQKHDMALPDGVLAYYLLECANLSKEQTSLCRATCNKLTYDEMKLQIERIHISNQYASNNSTRNNMQVEFLTGNDDPVEEDEFYEEDEHFDEADAFSEEVVEDTYFNRPTSRRPYSHNRSNYHSRGYRGGLSAPSTGMRFRCNHCKSTMHRIDSCPHMSEPSRPYQHNRGQRLNNNRGSFSRGRGKWSRSGNPSTHYYF